MKRLASVGLMVACTLAGCGHSVASTSALKSAFAGAGASALSQAGWLDQDQRAGFKARDLNGDGMLTPAELPELTAQSFAALDQDHDGKLTFTEAAAAGPTMDVLAKQAEEFSAARLRFGENSPLMPAESLQPLQASRSNPIIFVPGYLDLELYFAELEHRAHAQGRDNTYLHLFPNIRDIRISANALKNMVDAVKARTGAARVDLVVHSEGGLISRYYIQNLMATPSVEHLVMLATPNHGTVIAYLGPGMGARQMEPGSDFLKALNSPDRAPAGVKCTSIRAGLDEIVVPHDSPILAGAQNQLVEVAEHASIFVVPQALAGVDTGLRL